MFLKWLPWKFIVQRAARAYGTLDPVTWLARMRRFAQPSEVAEPLDLLRAGIVFHARGMINTRAIQNNLDWVWPYWVERQFNPGDISFIPRAFSLSHINLTHRNWTAVGLPDNPVFPVVDPRGLITPFHDGWSLDAWLVTEDGRSLLPSRQPLADQRIDLEAGWVVVTRMWQDALELSSEVLVEEQHDGPRLVVKLRACSDAAGQLIVSVRPYNPEGIQFLHDLALESPSRMRINNETHLELDPAPDHSAFSTYDRGDVFHHLDEGQGLNRVSCPVGMATGAVLYPLRPGVSRQVRIQISLKEGLGYEDLRPRPSRDWSASLQEVSRAQLPDDHMQYLYDTAVRSLILLSAGQVVPGPFTYRRFWFRDAVMMLNAILTLNMADRCREQLDLFFNRQRHNGYFASQEGEWDSNGQVLWLFDRFQRTAPALFRQSWMTGIIKGASWIDKKRLIRETGPHAGLLPAGFSAEHLGPNDYYYWDDFWSIAGLYGAGRLARLFADPPAARAIQNTARELEKATFDSIAGIPPRRSGGAIPASAHRRMDAGAIGSLSADYPLQLTPVADARIKATVDYLLDHCFFDGGFFQDMIHSGINAYLTLAIAQTLLRSGDARYRLLMQTVARLASGTGQWPEAVHPATHGGCMGDGHHGWAAAEWAMMIRNCFVREEENALIVGSGLFDHWLRPGETLSFGPTLTGFGRVSVKLMVGEDDCRVDLKSHWSGAAPRVLVKLPGFEASEMTGGSVRSIRLPEADQAGQVLARM